MKFIKIHKNSPKFMKIHKNFLLTLVGIFHRNGSEAKESRLDEKEAELKRLYRDSRSNKQTLILHSKDISTECPCGCSATCKSPRIPPIGQGSYSAIELDQDGNMPELS